MVRSEWAVALNSDTVVDAGWLDELHQCREEAAKAHPWQVGLVGSVMSMEEPRRWAFSVNPDYVTGHAWLLNMGAMEQVAAARNTPGWYLDETRQDMIHIRSDVGLCWDLNRLNFSCVKSFKSQVGHVGGASWGHNLAVIGHVTLEMVND